MSAKRKTAGLEQTQRVRTIRETTVLVNLDADPILPFAGAKVVVNAKGGWVKVHLRSDGKLYINGKPLGLYLSEKQKSGFHLGHELKAELTAKAISVLHPTIMDALIDIAPHLIPKALKVDEQGKVRYTYWWAVIYEDAKGNQYVRYCYFIDGAWHRFCSRLDNAFDWLSPAARAN